MSALRVSSHEYPKIVFLAALIAALLACMLFLLPASIAQAASQLSKGSSSPDCREALVEAVQAVRGYAGVSGSASALANQKALPAGESTEDMLAFDLARLQADSDPDVYLKALDEYVTKAYATSSKLDSAMSTPWARISLAVSALGGDATSFAKDANGKPIDLVADGTYNWAGQYELGYQGTNAWIWALYALACTESQVPADARYSTKDMLDALIALQSDNGAFGLYAGGQDVDLTAMALAALSLFPDDERAVAASNKAIEYLASCMGANGVFVSNDVETSESCAMAIVGLCAAGIDPRTDSMFVKNGVSAYDGLMSFRREDGSFSHSQEDDPGVFQLMATEQAMRALIALYEFDQGGDGNVYTLDISLNLNSPSQSGGGFKANDAVWLGVGLIVGIAVIAVLSVAVKRRRSGKPLD